jgi:hypothetical protein
MSLKKIYAHVDCSDLTTSIGWYEKLFARKPDALPMKGLAEWHHGEDAGFQLFEDSAHAGANTLTLIVEELREEHKRLVDSGMNPGEVESSKSVSIVRLKDPDGNLIVLAQSGAQ